MAQRQSGLDLTAIELERAPMCLLVPLPENPGKASELALDLTPRNVARMRTGAAGTPAQMHLPGSLAPMDRQVEGASSHLPRQPGQVCLGPMNLVDTRSRLPHLSRGFAPTRKALCATRRLT